MQRSGGTDRFGAFRRTILTPIRCQISGPLAGGDTGHRLYRPADVPARRPCSADDSVRDFVERGRQVVAAPFTMRNTNRPADVWSFCFWPAAENDVAGEQAFVLP